ncbi:D-tyrosyl-tRNA(Tyr) deacylase [bacterium]|nr:D-tyrosyl-tRNA(Tyr) deacylase [bacterium]
MRIVIQRVSMAKVTVENSILGEIQKGLLILVGITTGDTDEKAAWLAEKAASLRIFPDSNGKMNLDVVEAKGEILVVSQFTLYGDCSKGRRPSFINAARPEIAEPLYEHFIQKLKLLGIRTHTGKFGVDMKVELVNDGPVTLVVDA